MADPDKIPDSQMDTQATYDPTAEQVAEDTQPTQSSMLSESQDFRLIDEEGEKATQEETQVTQSKDNVPDTTVEPSADVEKNNASGSEAQATVRLSELESEAPKAKEDTSSAEPEKQNESTQPDDEDDDFIPSSQQATLSPLKKQISGLIGGISQKRKAESSEEPLAKFPRTCTKDDALSSVRKKLEDEEDIFDSELADDDTLDEAVTSNVIIAETPETQETESLQQVEKELEEALSQNETVGEAGDTEKKDKSSPVKVQSSTEDEKKSTVTEVLEDKIVSSMTEAIEEKKSVEEESTEEKISSATKVSSEEKSSNGEATEETKSSAAKIVEEEESSVSKVVEAEKSSTSEVEKETKTASSQDAEVEESKSSEAEKPVVDVSSQEPEKIDTTPDTTAKDDDAEPTKDATTTENTKDKEADAVGANAARKSDDSGISSQTPEIRGKSQTEMLAPIQVSSNKSRMSIEVIYDKATAPPEKKRPRELVEIDEEGEKIVLDSSQESTGCDKSMEKTVVDNKIETSYKTCDSKTSSTDYKSVDSSKDSSKDFKSGYSLTNGSTEMKKTDSDETASLGSDLLAADTPAKKIEALSPSKKSRLAPEILISISDSEGDSFVAEERAKNNKLEPAAKRDQATIKIVEKELSILVKLKCSVHIDESTKEHVEKFITYVHSESTVQDLSSTRRRHSDASASLADISGNAGENKDASPGSVTSNAQPYPLNPRLSLASTVSSSSASSAASMNAKLAANAQFQLPRVPAKHAKRATSEIAAADGKQDGVNEVFEQTSKEWKNVDLLLTSFFNCARDELVASELHNGSTERVDNSLERIRSSTPEVERKDNKPVAEVATPKNTSKRGRNAKRSRSNTVRAAGSNGITKTSPVVEAETEVAPATPSSSRKRKSSPETPSRQSTNSKDSLNDTADELVGKEVFAKWSDNKYYPGTVIGKTKTKFKVNFYDGQNKLIIEDFIVPMPPTLHVGLSVYATSTDDDYGSCGIIIDAKKVKDNVIYTVQTDEQEELRVQIKNIFLTTDQVQVLREDTKVELKTPPSTPKHLGKVTLDNVVDGKRRSKRITTPVVLTPKAKRARGSLADKQSADVSKPSTSGIFAKTKAEENYETTSDSNYSAMEETDVLGVQPELMGTANEQETKGPAGRSKGKARGRKRAEDPDVVAKLGPIPPANSNIFNGMSFLLTCASLDVIDRFQADTKDSNSDPGTENEEEWTRKPFVRDRLVAQINAGGGKLYESFEQIPPEEYERTKLITNVPNLTKKSLLCLSVGIKAYNHQWIIRCCKEDKIVNPSEEELPAGWSLMKQSYVEMFQRRNKKPFQTLPVIVVIPLIPGEKDFVTFWTQICQNAGGAVLLPENPGDTFIEGTVVLTNKRCPSWVVEKAKSWSIPLVSTTWVIQSLIEGNICTYDAHPSFGYNYVKRPSSHISNLKRLQ